MADDCTVIGTSQSHQSSFNRLRRSRSPDNHQILSSSSVISTRIHSQSTEIQCQFNRKSIRFVVVPTGNQLERFSIVSRHNPGRIGAPGRDANAGGRTRNPFRHSTMFAGAEKSSLAQYRQRFRTNPSRRNNQLLSSDSTADQRQFLSSLQFTRSRQTLPQRRSSRIILNYSHLFNSIHF